MRDILISIKPEFVEKILKGDKQYEYRKAHFRQTDIHHMFIYATKPVGKVVAVCEVGTVLSLSPDKLWLQTQRHSGITQQFFDAYFKGHTVAQALQITKVTALTPPKDLSYFGLKRAPQSFVYLQHSEL